MAPPVKGKGFLECPFCGDEAEPTGILEMRWVRCKGCAAEGPPATSDAIAAERWNHRVRV